MPNTIMITPGERVQDAEDFVKLLAGCGADDPANAHHQEWLDACEELTQLSRLHNIGLLPALPVEVTVHELSKGGG